LQGSSELMFISQLRNGHPHEWLVCRSMYLLCTYRTTTFSILKNAPNP